MSRKPEPETYANRVAQFIESEKRTASPNAVEPSVAPSDSEAASSQNPYLQARIKVLNGYSKERREIIRQCEQNHTLNVREYERFVFDILIAAGDVPTYELRKSTEECGCFSCRGKKKI